MAFDLESFDLTLTRDTRAAGFPVVTGAAWSSSWYDLTGAAFNVTALDAAGAVIATAQFSLAPGGRSQAYVAITSPTAFRTLRIREVGTSLLDQYFGNLLISTATTLPAPGAPPFAVPQSVTITEDASAGITLSGSDADGDSLTFTVTIPPGHGTLTGTAPSLVYVPAANYHGSDSFAFTASDGPHTSAAATVSIAIEPVNDAPVALSQSLNVTFETGRIIGMGHDFARSPFRFDPTLAAGESDRFSQFEATVGTELFPLGEAVDGNAYLVLMIGRSTDEAMTSLVEGRLPMHD